uniref:C3H1-type domain-containing protein n=1 Tax=Skeletonema marinoi TaxID=267567 RepID=A0A7S2KKX8_9STRA
MESILETSFATVDSTKSDGLNNEKENEKTLMAPITSTVLDMQGGVNNDPLLLPQCQLILDPKEKEAQASSSPPSSSSPSSDFPTLGEASDTKSLSQKQNGTTGKGRKSKKKKEANDLAAALFRPSRSRSNSLLDNSNQRPRALSLASSSMLRPSSADSPLFPAPSSGNGVGMGSLLSQSLENAAAAAAATGNANIATSPSSDNNTAASSPSAMASNNSSIQSEVISTTQLLLTLNSHLGTEAATLASQLTDGDLNLAQYLIEAARSDSSSDARTNTANTSNRRSRICRHELRGTCYRSDCPYSHDLGGVTCLFWLRGRCRGESCRFMHGFAESLLDGISEEYLNEKREQDAKKKEEEGKKIQTGNLLQHNQNQWTGASAGKNLSKSLPTQGFLFLSPSQGGTDSSMTTVWR